MQISLSRCDTPLNYIKTRALTPVASLNGYLKEACDVLDPDIEVEFNDAYLTANFAHIPAFHRFYVFRKPPTIIGKRMILHLHVDVVYSFREAILKAQVVAKRSASRYDLYLPDSAVQGEVGYKMYSSHFGNGYNFQANTGTYIFTAIDSGGSQT